MPVNEWFHSEKEGKIFFGFLFPNTYTHKHTLFLLTVIPVY